MDIKYTIIAEVDGEQVAKLETTSIDTAYDLVRVAQIQVDKTIEKIYAEPLDVSQENTFEHYPEYA